MQRGEVWWADLPEPVASEPGYRRPVIIVQANAVNRSRVATVLCVAITGNLSRAKIPGNVLLPSAESGLPRESVANVYQVITLDRGFLQGCIGSLPRRLVRRLEEGLQLVLQL